MRIAEAWLNLAEATACIGDDVTAQNALNTLREKRIQRDAFDKSEVNSLTGEALVFFIRKERQRELCLEGHRWFDLRRYGMPSISHLYKVRKSASWQTYTLNEKDPLYTLPLPSEVMNENPALQQNESAKEPTRQGR